MEQQGGGVRSGGQAADDVRIGDAEELSKWAQEAVDANPDYVKARLRVKSLEPQWRFTRPTSLEISEDGKILILDNQRARIQIYQKESDWVDPQFNLVD